MDKVIFMPISEIHDDHGTVLLVRFHKDEDGDILYEEPDVGIDSYNSDTFDESDWDVFAEIDWNPAFELMERINP